jgi:hypothetical protein
LGRKRMIAKHKRFRRKQAKNWCQVYVLKETRNGPPKYVGQTRQMPAERLRYHVREMQRALIDCNLTPVQAWLARLLPALPIIEVIDANGIWDISEAVWIDRLTTAGNQLYNVASRVPR